MSEMVKEAAELMEILPDTDKILALKMIKKLVLAWDPDFTKLTPDERRELEEARAEMETVSQDEIDWD